MLDVIFILAIGVAHGSATERQLYTSVARDKQQKATYFEQHTVEFSGERVQNARTLYLDNEQKVFAEMQSDFRQMLTLPAYEYKDLRQNKSHGVRIEKDSIILWRQNKGQLIEEKSFSLSDFKKGDLIVGCQGLHYYLISNLDEIIKKKSIAVKYMMPGALDYYSFTLSVKSEDKDFINLQLAIDNIFLKMLTSSLNMTYRKSDRRLVQYSGLSNITDKNDNMQFVNIEYKYSEEQK